MNIGTKFGNFPQAMDMPQAPQMPAVAPQPAAPAMPPMFEGAEHGDTVHFSGSCCK